MKLTSFLLYPGVFVVKTIHKLYLSTLICFPKSTVDHFVFYVRSVGTFARALDCSSSVKQPSLHMSAAAASRDITQVFECTI